MSVLGLGVVVRGQSLDANRSGIRGPIYTESPGKGNPRSSIGFTSLGESWDFCLYFGTKWDFW